MPFLDTGVIASPARMGFWSSRKSGAILGDGPADQVSRSLRWLREAGASPSLQELLDDLAAALRAAPAGVVSPAARDAWVASREPRACSRAGAPSRSAPVIHGTLRAIAREYHASAAEQPPTPDEVIETFEFVLDPSRWLRDVPGRDTVELAWGVGRPPETPDTTGSTVRPRTDLPALVREVLAHRTEEHATGLDFLPWRPLAPGELQTIVDAVSRHVDDPEVASLLLAARPACAAFIAPASGVVSIGEDAIFVHPTRRHPPGCSASDPSLWAYIASFPDAGFETVYRLWPREGQRLLVDDGARVAAGDLLTEGRVAIEDVNLVHGGRQLFGELTERFAERLRLPVELAALLAEPMLSMVSVAPAGGKGPPSCHRVVTARKQMALVDAAFEEGRPPEEYDPIVCGYDRLAAALRPR